MRNWINIVTETVERPWGCWITATGHVEHGQYSANEDDDDEIHHDMILMMKYHQEFKDDDDPDDWSINYRALDAGWIRVRAYHPRHFGVELNPATVTRAALRVLARMKDETYSDGLRGAYHLDDAREEVKSNTSGHFFTSFREMMTGIARLVGEAQHASG